MRISSSTCAWGCSLTSARSTFSEAGLANPSIIQRRKRFGQTISPPARLHRQLCIRLPAKYPQFITQFDDNFLRGLDTEPFHALEHIGLPVEIIVRTSSDEKVDKIIRAVFPPTPDTPISARNTSRSASE